MNTQHKKHLRSIATLTGFLAIVAVCSDNRNFALRESKPQINPAWTAQVGSQRAYDRTERTNMPQTFEGRIAVRMQQRLRKHGMRAAPSIGELTAAVKQRQRLLAKHVEVTFQTHDNPEHTLWDVSAQRYPLWLAPSFNATHAGFVLNTEQIKASFENESILQVDPPIHAVLKSVTWSDDPKVASKAEIEGVAVPGYLPDSDLIAASVAKAFESELVAISIPLTQEEGRLINATEEDLGELKLWSTGKSDYTGSTWGRQHNVRKALNEHVNNTVVKPGGTFAFNSTLDGPVSQGNGWAMAKVIYNGGDLEFAPGGGICQASTTTYRAIINAGFPVEERRAHSLYVSYYKKHGVGIDATIYPGSQDLVFRNDTDKPLVIQAYNDGTEAYVNIFGTPDGRTVALEGPYFTSTAPEGYTYNGRSIKTTEIVWDHRVHYPDGREVTTQIASRYRTLPQTLAREFAPEQTLYTSAPSVAVAE